MTTLREAGGAIRAQARALVVAGAVGALGCAAPVGGWDVEALTRQVSAVEAIDGQRLGDLTPYPALLGQTLALVVCRFDSGTTVEVRAKGAGWPEDWAQAALASLDASLSEISLVSAASTVRSSPHVPTLEVESLAEPTESGPQGLGDTLSECDVGRRPKSERPRDEGRVRGVLLRAEIRMRRAQIGVTGRVQEAEADAWTGAYLHELGHALGFAGHVAFGNSLLVRDEARLRAAGRQALAGRSLSVPSLSALYRVPPGFVLGERKATPRSVHWLTALTDQIAKRNQAAGVPARPVASVGDRAAQIVWRWPNGTQAELIFPFWRREIRAGGDITVLPSRSTRALLRAARGTPARETGP